MQGLEGCKDTFIGNPKAGIKGISGGEKRRTSVGMELVTSPKVLFLDEPTSGLDSEIAVQIIRTLNKIAEAGRTVALTIHQPNSDITELFDDFILMAKGRIMYAGAPLTSSRRSCQLFRPPVVFVMALAGCSLVADVLGSRLHIHYHSSASCLTLTLCSQQQCHKQLHTLTVQLAARFSYCCKRGSRIGTQACDCLRWSCVLADSPELCAL